MELACETVQEWSALQIKLHSEKQKATVKKSNLLQRFVEISAEVRYNLHCNHGACLLSCLFPSTPSSLSFFCICKRWWLLWLHKEMWVFPLLPTKSEPMKCMGIKKSLTGEVVKHLGYLIGQDQSNTNVGIIFKALVTSQNTLALYNLCLHLLLALLFYLNFEMYSYCTQFCSFTSCSLPWHYAL
ncbi:alpha-actinin 4 [Platysternon megacephalum]|uniref:Alpha-actinin 4 n=1 Tax=Platysternon megacephalum TaxID=55544 RepID=A0A4D9F3K3_9SAUR|nr:alpha-actinin 4 [Platysternon megacephalum]